MNRLVVVSNRVPDPSSGSNQAGGLAVALEGVMEKRGGLWFGWSGKTASGAASQPIKIAKHGQIEFATVDLTPDEHTRYYNNFSNGVLWPLLHTMPELMSLNRRDAQVYRAVNARFADQLANLIRPNDLIWVHDYHLLAMPALLRARNLRNPIGFFLHIPFPAPDVLSAAPDAAGLIRDVLAADLIGFQTDRDAENFAAAAQTFAGADGYSGELAACRRPAGPARRVPGRDRGARIRRNSRLILALRFRDATSRAEACRARSSILGVDRLDPTKGLMQRLAGLQPPAGTARGLAAAA